MGEGEQQSEMVPLARLQAATEARRAAESQAATLREELATAKTQASEAATLREALKAQQDTLKAERESWGQTSTLLERGLNKAEARDAALFFHSRLPAEGRPELGAWLDEVKGDPSKAPAGLVPYLTPAQQVAETQAKAGVTPGTVNKRVETTSTAGTGVTVEALRQAGERARSPSATQADRDAYAALRARLQQERR